MRVVCVDGGRTSERKCNSRLLLLRSLFLFALSFLSRVLDTDPLSQPFFASLPPLALPSSRATRAFVCALAKVSNTLSSRMLRLRNPRSRSLSHSLSLSRLSCHSCVRVCSREAYNPHSFRFVVRFRETTSSLSQIATLLAGDLAKGYSQPKCTFSSKVNLTTKRDTSNQVVSNCC